MATQTPEAKMATQGAIHVQHKKMVNKPIQQTLTERESPLAHGPNYTVATRYPPHLENTTGMPQTNQQDIEGLRLKINMVLKYLHT